MEVLVAYCEAQKSSVPWENGNMKIGILKVKGGVQSLGSREGIIADRETMQNFKFPEILVRSRTSKMRLSPPFALGIKK